MSENVLDNRSDFVVLYDVKNANHNGNPLSPDNEPRRDSATGLAEVTTGRIKRYIRDQMWDEGHNILVQKQSQYDADKVKGMDDMWEDIESYLEEQGFDLEETTTDDYFDAVLKRLMDVRFFGSVFAEAEMNAVRGPVQLQVGHSLHPTILNNETKKITGVLSTDDKGEGGSMGTDARLRYGLLAVDGSVNENVAQNNLFTEEDIEYLDDVIWRALITQTHSNSKSGQHPRGYIRVEYDTDNFQIANLSEYIDVVLEDDVNTPEDIRSINDYKIDITELVDVLEHYNEHINKVITTGEYKAEFVVDGEEVNINEALGNEEYSVVENDPFEDQ